MHRRWFSLPLLSTCVYAFYPYQNSEGEDTKSKRFVPFNVGQEGGNDAGVVTLDVKKLPVKRDNKFNVTNSSNPSVPNALSISEDGSDFTYFSTVTFGNPGREMYMLLDTGSANTWVMGSNCNTAACKIHNTFGGADSATLKTTTQSWSLSYGTGTVEGIVATDSVSFANYTVNLGFGLASSASDDFDSYPMDGIMGLGRQSSETLGTQTIMEVLDNQDHLPQNIIGVHLQRSSDGTNDGQITFGGVDSSKFSGKLGYTKTVDDSSWEIPVDDAGVNGKGVGFHGKSAIVDTGTSYMLLPPSDASSLLAMIDGSSTNGEVYTVPCKSTASVYVTFSGVKYTISPKDYVGQASGDVCNSNIIGHQAFGANQWIVGDVFLKNVYTVFDFDNGQIGFGTKSGSSSSLSTTSSTSSTSTSSHASSTESSSRSSSTATSSSTSGASSTGASSTASSGIDSASPFGSSIVSAAPAMTLSMFWLMLLTFMVGLSL